MADKSVDMQATDLFAFGAQFNPQSSASPHSRDESNILDADGNNECETMINNMTNYTNSLAYCNATPDIKTDLGTHLTTFAGVFDSKLLDSLTINFEAGAYATVDAAGHNHDNNAHADGSSLGRADVSAAVPASAGFGVPDFGLTLGTNATPISASLVFAGNHIDQNDADGEHWVGKTTNIRADLTLDIEGLPTSQTVAAIESDLTGWTVNTNGGIDSNQEFDTFSIAAHRYFDIGA